MGRGSIRTGRIAWRHEQVAGGERAVPEEDAVAFVYNGGTQAVMMATPTDLHDFAVGFSLTEGIVAAASEIDGVEIVESTAGTELRMWLPEIAEQSLRERRRHNAGPTGCGLCGIESLDAATRAAPTVRSSLRCTPADIMEAMGALAPLQPLGRETRAVHAAGFWQPGKGMVAVREDVGRHNALDKLAGALARADTPASSGLLLLTSRVSVELIQKAAMMGAAILVAVSAPTALAIRTADGAGITLVAIARDDGFEVFTHPDRISLEALAHGASVHVA